MKRFSLLALCLLMLLPSCLFAQQTVVKQSTPEPLALLAQDTSGNNVDGLATSLVASYTVGTATTEQTGTGTFTAKGNGGYVYTPASAELATVGKVFYRFHAAGMLDYWRELKVAANTVDDVFALLGTNQTALVTAIAANLTAINGLPSSSAIVMALLGATASSYNSAGTIGNKINSAASAGDPWTAALPGAYAAGSAGFIVGTNLNATISSRQSGNSAVTLPGTVLQSTDLLAIGNIASYGNLTLKQTVALVLALLTDADRTWNATTHTAVSTWYARKVSDGTLDKTRPVAVKTTVYDSTNSQIVSSATVLTPSNLY